MDYNTMSIAELKSLAKSLGIKGISTMKKSELAEALSNFSSEDKVAEINNKAEVTVKTEEVQDKPVVNDHIDGYAVIGDDEKSSNSSNNRNREYTRNDMSRNDQPRYNQQNQRIRTYVDYTREVDSNRNQRGYVAEGRSNYGDGRTNPRYNQDGETREFLDSGEIREGVLETVENYGFLRCDNYLASSQDVYVAPSQIRKFNLKNGDMVKGSLKVKNPSEKFQGFYSIHQVNGRDPYLATKRNVFDNLTPIFPNRRIKLETEKGPAAMRLVDLLSPIGKGQRGMIVAQPKAGKTTLLKQIANAITENNPDIKIIILLIDERPEEVTDMMESINGNQVEVIYSTFDETPEHHKKVAEMAIERAKRLVEYGDDVCILLDSITRLARAYNLTSTNSGRTLSGGLDPSALHMPKRFFGAARCMREGGSLTILATALVETGSRMDDVVFEEFKGTGNMELVLDRSLSERRIFPAIDLPKSGTRREDLLLTKDELEANFLCRNALNGAKAEDAIESILNLVKNTRNNEELVRYIRTKGVFAGRN